MIEEDIRNGAFAMPFTSPAYRVEAIEVRGAWAVPGSLQLNPHALAPVAERPVLEVVSAVHFVADLTLGFGKVVHDYRASVAMRATERRLACVS